MFEKFVHESVISWHIKLTRTKAPVSRRLLRFVMLMPVMLQIGAEQGQKSKAAGCQSTP